MKVIIAGSRSIENQEYLFSLFEKHFNIIDEVVSGGARGVDQYGEIWAEAYHIPWVRFPADWDKRGKGAGFIRNKEMADYADALIAVWDGKSRGTKHMIDTMQERGKPVYVYTVD